MSETATERTIPPAVGEIILGNRRVTKVEQIDPVKLIGMVINGEEPEDAEHLTVCLIKSTREMYLVWYENVEVTNEQAD